MKRTILTILLPLFLLVSSLSGQTSIEDLAPDDSVFLMSVRNLEESKDRFLKSPLGDLWRSDQVIKMRREIEEHLNEGLEEMAAMLEVEKEDFVLPTGAAGIAVYGYRNEETGTPTLGVLLTADYGKGAEGMGTVLESVLEKAGDEGNIEFETRKILGHTIYTVRAVEEPADEEADEDEFGGMMDGGFMPDLNSILGEHPEFHIVRAGRVFLAGNDLGSITAALEVIGGEQASVASERDDYRSMMAQLDKNPDMWSMILTANLPKLVAVFDPMNMSMMATPVLKAALGEIDGMGMSMNLKSPQAMMESTMFISMPNGKAGLSTLLAHETPIERVPSFVGANTYNLSRVNFDFPALANVLRDILKVVPMIGPPQREQGEEFIASIDRFTSALGTRVWVAQSMTRPITADSIGQCFAVECTKPEQFETALAEYAPMMGMEPRDFLGMRIYSVDMGMMGMGMGGSEIALGIGGRHILIGGGSAVEAGLRALSRGGPGGLEDDPSYRRMLTTLPAEPVVAWQYALTVDGWEAMLAAQVAQQKAMIEQFREFDPEMAAEMEADMKKETNPLANLDFDMLRRYIGPGGGIWRSTDEGFIMKAYLLDASNDDD